MYGRPPLETPKEARELVNLLNSLGGWRTRADIAHAMGKKRLDPGRAAVLDMLVFLQEVEARKTESNTPIGWRYEYRAKPRLVK